MPKKIPWEIKIFKRILNQRFNQFCKDVSRFKKLHLTAGHLITGYHKEFLITLGLHPYHVNVKMINCGHIDNLG